MEATLEKQTAPQTVEQLYNCQWWQDIQTELLGLRELKRKRDREELYDSYSWHLLDEHADRVEAARAEAGKTLAQLPTPADFLLVRELKDFLRGTLDRKVFDDFIANRWEPQLRWNCSIVPCEAMHYRPPVYRGDEPRFVDNTNRSSWREILARRVAARPIQEKLEALRCSYVPKGELSARLNELSNEWYRSVEPIRSKLFQVDVLLTREGHVCALPASADHFPPLAEFLAMPVEQIAISMPGWSATWTPPKPEPPPRPKPTAAELRERRKASLDRKIAEAENAAKEWQAEAQELAVERKALG
jgi:hypothetical protein